MSVPDQLLGSTPPSVQVEEMDPLIGLDLGGFKVVKLLAAGGMGLVYEALHPAIGRRAAVKVLKPEVAADAEWTKRFLAEARALGSIKHRNLIEVLNFGKTPDGREFLMMEFLDGEPLDAYIRRLGQLAPAVALGIADQILNGLAEAHKKGVVHRDLKPANVYLQREHNGELLVKVLDFGLARQEPIALVDGAVNLPSRDDGASLLAGTPEYIAPEQAQGKKVEGSADLYSLGIMIFEMVTGQLPFDADSVTALLQKHLSERPPKLSAVMNSVPEGLEEFVESLLLKEPERRPSSADAARVTVQRLLKRLAQDSTAVRMTPGVDPAPNTKHAPTMKIERAAQQPSTDKALEAAFPEKKSRGLVIALVALVLLLVGGLALTLGGEKSKPPEVVVQPEPVVTPLPPARREPVVEVSPVKEEPVVVAPEPAVVAEPVVALPQLARPRVIIEQEQCEPSEKWRQDAQADLAEMGERVKGDAALFDLWDREGRVASGLVRRATSSSECSAARTSVSNLKKRLRL